MSILTTEIIHAKPPYTLTTMHGTIFAISDQTRQEIISAASQGNKVYVFKQSGECIQLSPMPEIILFDRAKQKDKENLLKFKQFRCSFGVVHSNVGPSNCDCATSRTADGSPFAKLAERFSPKMQKAIMDLSQKMKIKPLTYDEKLIARAESGERRAAHLLKNQTKNV